MFWIGKLLGFLTRGKGFAEAQLFQVLFSSLIAVVGLTVIAGVITGALLLLAFYGSYLFLLSEGIASSSAIALIVLFMLIVVMILACAIRMHLKRLGVLPQLFKNHDQNPVTNYLQSVFSSFMQGYSATKPKRKRR